jgi:hypothetical protein
MIACQGVPYAFRRGAGDGDGRGEPGHPLGAGKSDLLRHDAFRRMRARQLSAPRDDRGLALEAITARAQQDINNGEAGADQHHGLCLGKPLGRQHVERRERPGRRRCGKAVGGGEQHDVGLKRFSPVEMQREVAAIADAGGRHRSDDLQFDIRSRSHRREEALAHIFAEQLARQEGMGEALMQACMIFALVELAKGPIQEIAGLIGADRQVARALIEKVQGMMRATTPRPSETLGSTTTSRKGRSSRARQAIAAAAPVNPPPTTPTVSGAFRISPPSSSLELVCSFRPNQTAK